MNDCATCAGLAHETARLLQLVQVGPVPLDFSPRTMTPRQVISEIRDAYSNYEDLLPRLAAFCRAPERGQPCPPIRSQCPAYRAAYRALKREANCRAKAAYTEWLQRLQDRAALMGQVDEIARRAWEGEDPPH